MVVFSPTEIDALVSRAQDGDKEAIASLYQQFVDRVYRYVASRVPDASDAEDVTADVFLQMLDRANTYEVGAGQFQRWLYQIAKHCVSQYEAKQTQDSTLDIDSVLQNMLDQQDAPEKQFLEHEQLEQLRNAMRNLSHDEYTVLILRFVENKSHEEVATIMDKSTAATRITQFRALKNLAKALKLEKKRHYLRPSSND